VKKSESQIRRHLIILAWTGLIVVCTIGSLRVAKAQKRSDAESRRVAGIAKLHEMACKLRLGMSKAEVEKELGKGIYSPTRGVFVYRVDAEDDVGIPFALVVEYRRMSYRDGEEEKYTGKLEEYWVGRIAE
jgi:hypothetical protein